MVDVCSIAGAAVLHETRHHGGHRGVAIFQRSVGAMLATPRNKASPQEALSNLSYPTSAKAGYERTMPEVSVAIDTPKGSRRMRRAYSATSCKTTIRKAAFPGYGFVTLETNKLADSCLGRASGFLIDSQ